MPDALTIIMETEDQDVDVDTDSSSELLSTTDKHGVPTGDPRMGDVR